MFYRLLPNAGEVTEEKALAKRLEPTGEEPGPWRGEGRRPWM